MAFLWLSPCYLQARGTISRGIRQRPVFFDKDWACPLCGNACNMGQIMSLQRSHFGGSRTFWSSSTCELRLAEFRAICLDARTACRARHYVSCMSDLYWDCRGGRLLPRLCWSWNLEGCRHLVAIASSSPLRPATLCRGLLNSSMLL